MVETGDRIETDTRKGKRIVMEGDKKNVGAPLPDEALDAVAGGAAAVQDDRVIVEGGELPLLLRDPRRHR